jgi:hypothetical protein
LPGSNNLVEVTLLIALVVAAACLFLYASYWALTTRKVLVSRIYRRQALWVAVNGLYFTLFFVFAGSAIVSGGPEASGTALSIVAALFAIAAFVVIFGWMDASIRVARRSDPLHRNTLHWTGLRYFIVVATIFALFFNLIGPIFFAAQQQNSPSAPVGGFSVLGTIGAALLLGGIALIVSARRSGDTILQRHLRWFGAFIILLFLTSEAEKDVLPHIIPQDLFLFAIINYTLYWISSLLLYESARSLAKASPYPSPVSLIKKGPPEGEAS